MSSYGRISKAFQKSLCLPLDSDSKYVIFSDCHRGTGKTNDNFLKNELLYFAALKYYYKHTFTYIELGDGDELWENHSFHAITQTYPDSFAMLSKFHLRGKFFSVYGNHDIVKQNPNFTKEFCQQYDCKQTFYDCPLSPDIIFYPSIILKDCEKRKDVYLTHGHQADLLNSTLWPISRFLVRYIWRPLESLGIPDPTSAAKNHHRKKSAEKHLVSWAKHHDLILITGHTHHPMVGTPNSPYFNTGSCVSPSGITCIEITNRCISLIKWSLKTNDHQVVYIGRSILGNRVCIDDY